MIVLTGGHKRILMIELVIKRKISHFKSNKFNIPMWHTNSD